MNKYDVSAIIPLYRGCKYIEHLIELFRDNIIYARRKNLYIHLEVIMINDYPDEEIDINDVYEEFNTIYLINERNLGIHETRVKGIERASGEFLFIFDQDDEITEDYLYSQFKAISSNKKVSMVISNGIIQHPSYERKIYERKIMHLLSKFEWFYALFDNRIISPGQCLIRRSAIPPLWLENRMKHNGADDLLLWLLILDDNRFCRPLLNTRCLYTHVNTNNNTSLNLSEMYASVDEMLNVLVNNNMCSVQMINLIGYRNDYQKGMKSNFKVHAYEKCLVKLIYYLRKKKKEEVERNEDRY